MDNKKKIAFCSILIGFVAITTTLSTWAWFDGSSALEVSNMNITLADKHLYISTDNVNFKESLSTEDLNDVDFFRPVSSMFSSSWINTKSESPIFKRGFCLNTVEKPNYTEEEDYPNADKGYFSQVLYLKGDLDGYVTIDPSTTTFVPDEEKNDSVAISLENAHKFSELTHEQIVQNLNTITKSLRFSILVLDDENEHELEDYAYYTINPFKESETYLGGVLDNDTNGFYDYYNGKEVLFGEASNVTSDTLVYDIASSGNVTSKTYSVFDAVTADDIEHLNFEESLNQGLVVAKENAMSLQEAESIRIPISTSTSKRIVLSMYLEGWDKDNNNLTMYSYFKTNISFRLTGGSGK